ncbi:MAG: amino acid adenylation domain-containing protein, partial [Lysobacteraceae bacterium]
YADYAAWQRERLSGDRLARVSAYWRETLQGAPSLLELPTDRKRPAEQDYRGALLEVRLDAALASQLKALSLKHGGTLYMTLMAAWSVVLSRLSGQTEVVVGTPVANRTRREVEGLIGFFVNTLAVRVDLENDPTVSSLIEQVKQRVLSAQEHQELPFEQVVEVVNPARSLGYAPIFQAMFAWQNNESGALRFEGLQTRYLDMPHAVSTFDLTLSLAETAQGIEGAIEYSTTLFDAATIQRYTNHLRQVLLGMVADADQPVSRLPLMEADEYRALTQPMVVTASLDREVPIQTGFERCAAATPYALAVTCEGVSLTYGELNARANRLAHWLRAQGVGPETLVAVCMSRSPRVLEAMLAVLKAGGGYLPLDPASPQERLRDVLGDAQPRVVLVDAAARAAMAAIHPGPLLIDADVDATLWDAQPAHDPMPEQTGLTPAHLAYVIYTSGSTGKPKGVMIEHRHIAAIRAAWAEIDALRPGLVHLQMANIAFDVFTADWLRALTFGGTLAMCSQAHWSDSAALYRFMRAQRVTFADFVPGVLNTLIAHLEEAGGDLGFMETLLCGSDLWTRESAERLRRLCGDGVRIANAYGLTEAAVDSTRYPVSTLPLRACDTLPIGKAIPNVAVYVLDGQRQPCPVGVIGELYIGGASVARGYLNRPELTAERFVANPFVSGERLYRTGDLARRLLDGNLEYLGRNDFQVKVRGYRIELGEIEAKLAAQPGIREAVVLARQDAAEQMRLVAYYECDRPGGTNAEALRSALRAALPDYMVPAAYVEMMAWPFTANGKLDRRALPAPERSAGGGSTYAAPEGAVESGLAAIWAQLLGAERVGRHDNFFELGGHSLLAVRLTSVARKQLSLEIPLNALFQSPTVAELAARLKKNESEMVTEGVPSMVTKEALSQMTPEQFRALRRRGQSIQAIPRDGREIPVSFAQQRLWFLSQMDASSDAYHIALGVELTGALNRAALQGALDQLVARHESLRTSFEAVDGVPYQRIGAPAAFALIEHD